MNKNKKIVILAIVLLTIFTGLLFGSKYYESNENKVTSKDKNYKLLGVKYLVMDKNEKEYTVENVFPEHFKDLETFANVYVEMKKQGDYYVANLRGQANEKILNSITDAAFALNDVNGNVIKDCKFDKNKMEIKVPTKYYEKESKKTEAPVQVEFLSRLSKKELQKINIDTTFKKFTTKKQTIIRNGFNENVQFTISSKLKSSKLSVYANDTKLTDDYYNYNSKTGRLLVELNPILIDNLRVEYDNPKSLIKNVSATINVHGRPTGSNRIIPIIEIEELPERPSVGDGSTGASFWTSTYSYAEDDSYEYNTYPSKTLVTGTQVDLRTLGEDSFGAGSGNEVNVVVGVDTTALGFTTVSDPSIIYTYANCGHVTAPFIASVGAAANYYTYDWQIANVDEDGDDVILTVVYAMSPNTWTCTGDCSSTVQQTVIGIIKFKYKETTEYFGYIDVTKTYIGSDDGRSRKFYAYDSTSTLNNEHCSGSSAIAGSTKSGDHYYIGWDSTNNKAVLPLGTYYVCEKDDGLGGVLDATYDTSYKVNGISTSNYGTVALTADGATWSEDYNSYHEEVEAINRQRKYCYAGQKKDIETHEAVQGPFTLTSGSESVTLSTSNSIAVFGPHPYDTVWDAATGRIKVKISEQDLANGILASNGKYYWTIPFERTVSSGNVKEANYNSSNKTWTCPAFTSGEAEENVRQYYCIKIKKKDNSSGGIVSGATFQAKGKTSGTTANSVESTAHKGTYSIFVGPNYENFTITETTTPAGYSPVSAFDITSAQLIKLPETVPGSTDILTGGPAKTLCESDNTVDQNYNSVTSKEIEAKEKPLVYNWYKTLENGTTVQGAAGAEFKVTTRGSSTALKFNEVTSQTDDAGTTKNCYVYNTSGSVTTLKSDANGSVCIAKIPTGNYTVTETKAVEYHTFGSSDHIDFTITNSSTRFAAISNDRKFVNYETEFEFTKYVSSGDTNSNDVAWNTLTTKELKKLSFNIIRKVNGVETTLTFKDMGNGKYEYTGNTVDGQSGSVTDLKLNDNRKFFVYHLPVGDYYVKEKKVCCSSDCASCTGGAECSGYYYPGYNNESDYKFTITACSSSKATASVCSNPSAAKKTLTNTPTEITFTKKDLYHYANPNKEVKFENQEEINAFDNIKFRLKDENGNYVQVIKEGTTGTCKDENSFSTYRYVPDTSLLSAAERSKLTYDIYTCGGHIKINHLCRGKKWTIVEYELPKHTVFTTAGTTSIDYLIPFDENNKDCCTNKTITPVKTNEINDEPTRIVLNKKNIKPSEDIHEGTQKIETASFEVYRCPLDSNGNPQSCKPSDYAEIDSSTKKYVVNQSRAAAAGIIRVKFEQPTTINNETVYEFRLDQSNTSGTTTTLNLTTVGDKGQIVIRYLPTDYKYVLLETNGPDGYYNVEGEFAETKIDTVPTTTTDAAANKYNVNDYPTQIKFKKDDIYKYYKASDKDKMNSQVGIFDSMTFVLRDQNGQKVTLSDEGNGTYRFIQRNGTTSGNNTVNLHTHNGELIIQNLYRNQTYYIEETKTDTLGNFILPTNVKKPSGIPSGWTWEGHPYVKYTIGNTMPSDTQGGTVPSESVTQLIENLPTRVVFEKRDKKTGELVDDNQNHDNSSTFNPYQTIKTTFNVYRCPKTVEHCRANTQGAELVYFTDRAYVQDAQGNDLTSDITAITAPVLTYKYSKLNSSSGAVSDLITDRGLLVLAYLPSEYSYSLYEKTAPNGYYQPTGEEAYTDFTVLASTASEDSDYVELTSIVENKPTSINFVKSDIYDYYEDEDLASLKNESLKIFDSMTFVLKDKNGNIMKLKCAQDGELVNNKNTEAACDTGEYRYIPVNNDNVIEHIHTKKGKLKISHLYRGETYYIEEITNDTEGDFTIPDYLTRDLNYGDQIPFDNHGHPVVKYVLPAQEPASQTSVTAEIKNVPTRVRFEKRDSKYNYLIPDDTTTFKVYQCDENNDDCHPADYSTDEERAAEGIRLINFEDKVLISGDQEDSGIKAYKYKKLNASGITELHPDNGILVLRYLPSNGYKYVLVETKAPKNYILPSGRDVETPFVVASNTAYVNEVDVPNAPTSLLIKKYDDNGNLLKGAQFRIYEGTTCDPNLSAMNQPKTNLKLKTIRDGVYEARPPFDDSDYTVMQTCDDANGTCSAIPTDSLTRLTYEDAILNENINNTYVDSYADFNNLLKEDDSLVEIKEGEILVQYLEYGHCYIIEEIKAPKGYSLPKHEEDRFTVVTMEEDERYVLDTGKALINKPTPFTFYKFDEYNQLIDGAEFKLQKLDDNKKYHDLTVTEIEEAGMLFYKADENSENKTIKTKNGSATVYFLEPGQYRILETKAPEGKELSKNPNIATFFVDDAGNVYGNSLIVNKATTNKTEVPSYSQAEYIINIQTGQTVIRYGIIIGILVAIITGLMILRKKTK